MEPIYDGPKVKPPTISLLTAADIIPIENGHWEQGFKLVNEGPEAADVQVIGDCPVAPTDTERTIPDGFGMGAEDPDDCGAAETYTPFYIFGTDKASTFQRDRDFWGRAQRKLEVAEAAILEEQLWTAAFQSGQPHLADSAGATNYAATVTVASTVTDAWQAFAILEQEMSEASATRGMIHVRPQVLTQLVQAQVVRRVGNVYLSPLDNIVVPGRGYPGTGPNGQAVGATEWMFAHPGIVQIRRSEIERMNEDDLRANIDRTTNRRQAIVQRAVHVALDTTLGVFAIDFNSLS